MIVARTILVEKVSMIRRHQQFVVAVGTFMHIIIRQQMPYFEPNRTGTTMSCLRISRYKLDFLLAHTESVPVRNHKWSLRNLSQLARWKASDLGGLRWLSAKN